MTTAQTNAAAPVGQRIPPQDIDAEMALLGAMMMSREAIGSVLPLIQRGESHWFYVPAHQRLFEVLIDLYDDPAQAIDLIVVADVLRRRKLLDLIGGQEYVVRLAESFSDWANAEHYAKIVRDKGMLRDLIRCTTQIADDAYHAIEDPREILDRAEQRIFLATERRVSGEAAAIRETLDRLSKQLSLGHEGVCTGIPTGFTQLDEFTSGLQYGDLIVVAGRPSMGKTALGLTLALEIASHERPVAFFSMEMSKEQVAQRILCARANVDAHRLRRRILADPELKRLLDACDVLQSVPLYVDDTPGMTALELRAKARRLKLKHDIQVVFIDYLQLMHMSGAENRQAEIAAISRSMKALGRELSVPIVAMAQLNRMPEGRHDKRPLMSDLRESGAIEQDADVVLLIHREEYYRPEEESVKGLAELIIAKQRNGPTGTVRLQFNKKQTTFHDRYEGPEPEGYEDRGSENVPF